MSLVHYTNCPICGAADIKEVFAVKDHTVSGESFTVVECINCSLRFTQDVPDAASIAPYYKSEDYISHTDTSKGLINRLYRWVRKRTLKKKRKLMENLTGVKSGHLLDVGSGTGAFVNEMNEHGWQVTGLEPDEGARGVARKLYNAELKDITEFYQLPSDNFDAITLWHVLEHVHELFAYVEQLKKLLKVNGKLFIAVPNYTSKDAAIYKEYWAAYDVPRHLYHFSPKSMQVLMEKHGLKLQGYKPMWYDSFYISMLSSKYKNGKSNLIAAFFNGFRSNLNAMGDVKRCSSVIYVVSPNHPKEGL
ncbi:MAG TPA: class I SAM-dependent methyltransferase [Chitinophagaceae bacterium]|nr:class I SAM-dependent methyltransferase [Chitinophagaceae bacterium]